MLYPKLRNSTPVLGWIDSEEYYDTYLNQEPPATEPARCPVCDSVYLKKEWHKPGQTRVDAEDLPLHICPACQEKLDGYYRGVLTLHGGFIIDHHEEISHLILNEIRRRQEKNPLHRVVRVEVNDNRATLKVTRGKLAERIGRKLKKAYGGDLEVKWSDRITRVEWSRDRQPKEE